MTQRILITGYGGFLGSHIAGMLLAKGYEVHGLARNDYPHLRESGVIAHIGDISNQDVCRRAMKGVHAIVHTAALAGVWGRRIDFESINVDATDCLLATAHEFNVQAFVHCSSPSVTFDGSPQSGIDESVGYPTNWLCDYPRTKAIAEQHVLAAHDPNRLWTIALRPHLIWGEGDPHLIPRLITRCRQGGLRRIGSGRNLIDTVHVANAASAHVLALEKLLCKDEHSAGRSFFITDGQPIECWAWISQILLAAGLKVPKKSISLKTALRLGSILEPFYRMVNIKREPPMTRFVALQLGVDHYFSIQSARNRLGYSPVVDRTHELERMAPWLKRLAQT